MALSRYDIGLLEEAFLLKWHGQAFGQQDYTGKDVREAATPFIAWLREVEDEEQQELADSWAAMSMGPAEPPAVPAPRVKRNQRRRCTPCARCLHPFHSSV